MDLAQLKRAHVLVTGDAMLDRYWFGDAERISPEASKSFCVQKASTQNSNSTQRLKPR